MADRRYGEHRGGWGERERERDHSTDYRDRGSSGGEEDRGFFERAGEEIRSWFGSDDEEERGRSDYGRGQSSFDRSRSDYGSGRFGGDRGFGSQGQDRGRVQSWSEGNRGSGTFGDERSGLSIGGGSDFSRNRGEWSEERSGRSGYGRQHGIGGFQGDYGGGRGQGGFGGRGDWEGGRESFSGRSGMSGSPGGSGNRPFGSSQDDHYRSWRDRQIDSLDRDYQDYCRERETQFHSDFDSWRKTRQGSSESQSSQGGTSTTGSTEPRRETLTEGKTTATPTGSFIGGGGRDPSAGTAGGGGDPDPVPPSTGRSRSSRSR